MIVNLTNNKALEITLISFNPVPDTVFEISLKKHESTKKDIHDYMFSCWRFEIKLMWINLFTVSYWIE